MVTMTDLVVATRVNPSTLQYHYRAGNIPAGKWLEGGRVWTETEAAEVKAFFKRHKPYERHRKEVN